LAADSEQFSDGHVGVGLRLDAFHILSILAHAVRSRQRCEQATDSHKHF
jgi:hypothetical protein